MWESFGFEFINFYFVPGLVLGCIYALGAIGITLTFGILRFANFSHGEIMMTSSYLTWEFIIIFASIGIIAHPLIGAIPASICAILLALFVDEIFKEHIGWCKSEFDRPLFDAFPSFLC